jgi:hypothetical protein
MSEDASSIVDIGIQGTTVSDDTVPTDSGLGNFDAGGTAQFEVDIQGDSRREGSPATHDESDLSPMDVDDGSIEWGGTKFTVTRDTRYGTYKIPRSSTPDDSDAQDVDADPFAIFGGYEQYQFIHMLATSGLSKAKITEFLALKILVCENRSMIIITIRSQHDIRHICLKSIG